LPRRHFAAADPRTVRLLAEGRSHEVPVTVEDGSQLSVQLRGKPGSELTIWIEGHRARLPSTNRPGIGEPRDDQSGKPRRVRHPGRDRGGADKSPAEVVWVR